jgi:hypothetical protein
MASDIAEISLHHIAYKLTIYTNMGIMKRRHVCQCKCVFIYGALDVDEASFERAWALQTLNALLHSEGPLQFICGFRYQCSGYHSKLAPVIETPLSLTDFCGS